MSYCQTTFTIQVLLQSCVAMFDSIFSDTMKEFKTVFAMNELKRVQ